MVVGEILKLLREQKNMSQGDIQKRTGLLRCYVSRAENGHTVPSVDTLERLAQALEIPMYRFFTEDAHVKQPNIPAEARVSWATNSKREREPWAFARFFSRMHNEDRGLLIQMASKMARRA
jgi:transcriptional regulator with XRE-family HTH domain